MSNLTCQIQKLAKGLNKFTVQDILQILPASDDEINVSLNELEANFIIKKISDSEYLYIKSKRLSYDLYHTISAENLSEWVTIDEACKLTGQKKETIRRKCKNKTYESKFTKDGKFKEYLILRSCLKVKPKIQVRYTLEDKNQILKDIPSITDRVTFLKSSKDQAYFNSLPEYAQKYVFTRLTIFKLAGKLRGKELDLFLRKLSLEHPEYKMSYSTFISYLKNYAEEGIKALVPKYGKNRFTSCIPPDMYEQFKKIYLAPNKYSLTAVVKMLPLYGFDESAIPSSVSFKRRLRKEYSQKYIDAIKNAPLILPDLEENVFPQSKKKKEKPPLYSKYIDATNAFLKSIKNDSSNTNTCHRGHIENHLNPYFKNFDIDKITQEDILQFQSIKIAEGYSYASVKRFLSTFTTILKFNHSKFAHLTFSRKNTLLPPTSQKCLSKKEINNLIKSKSPELWILILGIKPSELLALEYKDINFKERTVLIDKFLVNNEVQKHRKIYKQRTLHLPNILLQTLNPKGKGRIFQNVESKNYDMLVNTHVKLLLEKNVSLNIIYKILGLQHLNEFEVRFNFLLPQKLDDGFEIL